MPPEMATGLVEILPPQRNPFMVQRVKKLIRERGRPPIPEADRRTVRINVFVTRAEYEKLAKEAERLKTSVVDLVRGRALSNG